MGADPAGALSGVRDGSFTDAFERQNHGHLKGDREDAKKGADGAMGQVLKDQFIDQRLLF